MSVVYIVRAKAEQRIMSMGTRTAADALQCARQFLEAGKTVTIMDPSGVSYEAKEFRKVLAKADPDGLG